MLKIKFMKYFLVTACMTVIHVFCWSQPKINSIEYKGGKSALEKIIFKYLDKSNGAYSNNEPEKERQGNKYFIVVLTIDNAGRFNSDCSILSMQDTTNTHNVLAAFRQTDGNWINHRQLPTTVLIPVYFLYDDPDIKERNPVMENYFHTYGKENVICLEPFVVTLFPSVR